jgi:endonuclease VIII
LKKHWLIYGKSICPRCKIKIQRKQTGGRKRLSYYCNNCQMKYE